MTSNPGSKTAISMILMFLTIVFCSGVKAGGFWLSVKAEKTGANSPVQAFFVQPLGCGEPTNADISATEEGIVKGERQSVSLEVETTGEKGYRIPRKWTGSGKWVVVIQARYRGEIRNAVIDLTNVSPDDYDPDRVEISISEGKPGMDEIEVLLRSDIKDKKG